MYTCNREDVLFGITNKELDNMNPLQAIAVASIHIHRDPMYPDIAIVFGKVAECEINKVKYLELLIQRVVKILAECGINTYYRVITEDGYTFIRLGNFTEEDAVKVKVLLRMQGNKQ